jgi:hypothetical protein
MRITWTLSMPSNISKVFRAKYERICIISYAMTVSASILGLLTNKRNMCIISALYSGAMHTYVSTYLSRGLKSLHWYGLHQRGTTGGTRATSGPRPLVIRADTLFVNLLLVTTSSYIFFIQKSRCLSLCYFTYKCHTLLAWKSCHTMYKFFSQNCIR